jgi:DNA adenine methylase
MDAITQKTKKMTALSPILRWAGSKRQILPTLVANTPKQYGAYIEPFAGSACLFFALQPERAVIGDFNAQLIVTYQIIADAPRAVAKALSKMPTDPEFYYELRARDITGLSLVAQAARFVYLNRFSFNGVYRTNRQGRFNVPRGTKTGALPTAESIVAAAKALGNATFVCGDFEKTLDHARRGDFVYMDPPYRLDEARMRGEYGYGAFSSCDLDRLADALVTLDHRGVKFLLSYKYRRDFHKRMQRWCLLTQLVRRHVGGFAERRSKVRELIVSNYPLITP